MMLISSLLVTVTKASAAPTLASSRIAGSRTSPFRTTVWRSCSATRSARARVGLDQLERDLGPPAFQLAAEEEADIAAAGDDDPLAHLLLVAEGGSALASWAVSTTK